MRLTSWLSAFAPRRVRNNTATQPKKRIRRHVGQKLECLEDRTLLAATLKWVGDVDSNWSTSLSSPTNTNWDTNTLPVSGDTLVFDTATAGLTRYLSSNDIAGLTGITIQIVDSDATFGNDFVISGTQSVGITAVSADVGASDSNQLSLPLSGVGGTLTKSGTGTLTVSGTNTYSGTTTVGAGTLSISGDINGSATLAINGGTLSTTGADKLSDSAVVTVSGGSLTIGGPDTMNTLVMSSGAIGGSQTLTAMTYGLSGGTVTGNLGTGTINSSGAVALGGTAAATVVNVTAGTLTLGNTDRLADGATVTVSGGTLAIGGHNDTVGAVVLASGSITGSGGILTSSTTFDVQAGGVSAILGGSVGLTKSTSGTVTLSGANSYTGATTITSGTLQVTGSLAAGSTVGIGTAGTLSGSGTVNGNATLTGSGIINLTNPGTIAGTLGVTGGNWNGAGNVTGLVTASSGTFTIGTGANLTANGNLSVTGGTLASGNSTSTITGSVTYASSSSSNFGGVIAGSGKALTMNNSAATLTLGGTNTYTGVTTITAGTLSVGSIGDGGVAGNLGQASNAAANIVFDGGTLQYTGNADVSTNRAFTINNGKTATFDITVAATDLTISGATTATTGGLTKTGPGTLQLSGTNLHTGVTTFADGVLSVATIGDGGVSGNLGAAASAAGNLVFDGGTLRYTGANAATNRNFTINPSETATLDVSANTLTVSGAVPTTTGALAKQGDGTLILSGNNAYSGLTTVGDGTLKLGAIGSSGNSPLGTAATGTTVASGAILDLNGLNLAIAEPLTLNNVGNGFGALQNSSGSASYSGSVTLSIDSSIGGTGNLALSGVVGGANSLTKAGGGTLTLSNSGNTFGGAGKSVTVNDGTLSVSSDGNLGNSANSITIGSSGGPDILATTADFSTNRAITLSNGTIDVASGTTLTASGQVTGAGGLTKTGAGTLTLSNSTSNYTGTTTINAGTLLVGANAPNGSAGALGNSSTAVLLGATTGSSDAALLIGGAFTVVRGVTVQSGNTGVMTLGGSTAAASIFSGAITLGTASSTKKDANFIALAGGSVDFTGVIAENSGITAGGVSDLTIGNSTHSGTVKFSSIANTYSGSTSITNGATLEVTKLANGGSISSIGNSGSAAAAGSAASDLVINNGTLKYTGTGDTTNRLFTIGTGGATIDASGASNAAVSFTGTGSLVAPGSGNRTLTLTGTSTGANSLASVIANPGTGDTSLTKTGAGAWTLAGSSANTYSGMTSVNEGILSLNKTGVTAVAGDVTIGNGTGTDTLKLLAADQIANASEITFLTGGVFDLNGKNESVDKISSTGMAGSINNTFNGTTTLTVGGSGGSSSFDGNIANSLGTLALTKSGAGTLTLSGMNTYGGDTTISAGTLKVGGPGAIPDGSNAGNVVLAGTLDLGGSLETINGLSGAGTITTSTALATPTLTVGGNDQSSAFSGIIQDGSGTVALTKTGTGTLTLTGISTYKGLTRIDNGRVNVNSSGRIGFATSQVMVYDPGILGGTGTVLGTVTHTGTAAPGPRPGVLQVSGTFGPIANVNIEIGGPTAGGAGAGPTGGYDQVDVTGSVNLAGTTALNLTLNNFSPSATTPDKFTIIKNDGTEGITNTFSGKPEGKVFNIGGVGGSDFQITYRGGVDNNDVVLTTINPSIPIYNGTPGVDAFAIRRVGDNIITSLNTIDIDSRDISTISGGLTINGGAGNDTLTVNLDNSSIPTGGIRFNGGESAGDDDRLIITGSTTVPTVAVNHTGAEAGNIVLSGLGTISFTEIEPLVLDVPSIDLTINLPAGPNTDTTFGDDGVAPFDGVNDAGKSAIYDSTNPYSFEYTQFTNPTNSLTINRGSATDNLTILDRDAGFGASLTIGSAGNGFATVSGAGDLTLGAGKNLSITATAGINLTGTLIVPGTTSLTAGAGVITAADASNNFTGAVTLSNSGNNAVSIRDVDAILLGTSSVGDGTLSVTAVGITQSGALTQSGAGAATFDGGAGVIALTQNNNFVGAVSLNNSGANAVSVTDTTAIILAASSVGTSTLTVNAIGITQSGVITQSAAAGAVTITGNAGAVILANAGNDFTGQVTVTNSGANNVSVRDANALSIGGMTLGTGTLVINAVGITQTGAITQSGGTSAVTITGNAGAVTLSDAGNDFRGSVTVTNSGANNVSVRDTNALSIAGMSLGTGTLAINAVGITQTGAISQTAAAGAVTITGNAGAVILSDSGNDFTGTLSVTNSGANNVSVRDTNALSIGGMSLGTGTLAINAVGITQTGAISQTAAAGAVTITGNAGAVILSDSGNDFTGALSVTNSGANDVSVRDTNALSIGGMTLGTGTLAINAVGITQTGAITQTAAAGAVTITGNAGAVTLTTATNNFTGTVTVASGAVTSIDDDDAITFSTVTTTGSFTVDAGGNVTFNGAVSATTGITVQGGQDGSGSVSVATGSLVTSAGGSDIAITAGGTTGNIALAGTVTAIDRLTLTSGAAGGGVNQTAGTVTAPNLQLTGSNGAFVLTQGTNNFGTVAANLNGGSINLTDSGSIIVGTVGTTGIDTGSSVNGGAVTINATSGTITVSNVIDTSTGTTGGISITGAVIVDAAITAAGGNVTLNGSTAGGSDLDINFPLQSSTTLNLTAPRDILVGALVQTTGVGADIILTADTDANGSGGVLIETNGQTVASDTTTISGSDLNAVVGTESVQIDSDGTNNQVEGNGAIQIIDGPNAPAGAQTIINGRVFVAGAGAALDITAEGSVLFGANGDVTSSNGVITITADTRAGNNTGAVAMNADAVVNAGTSTISMSADGDITLGSLTTTNNTASAVSITTSNGGVLDAGGVLINIIANSGRATVTAVTGIGSADAIETTIDSLDASVTTAGNISIVETDAINLLDVDTADGSITVTAGGAITATDVVSTTDANANDITLTANSGGILVALINAGTTAGDVTLTATGAAISETATDGTVDIVADDLALSAATGIGSADALETTIIDLAFSNATSDDVRITELAGTGGFIVNSIGALTSSTNAGNTFLISNSPITFAVNTTQAAITAQAIDSGAANVDNITVNSGVTVTASAGSVLFQAGDRIVVNSTAVVTASSNVTFESAFGDTDTDGAMTLDGTITANAVTGVVTLDLGVGTGNAVQAGGGTITGDGLQLLSATAGGSFNLASSVTNNVNDFAANTDGTIDFTNVDSVTITVVGATTGLTTTGDDVRLVVTAGSFTISRAISLGAGDLELTATTGATQAAAGTITANGLALRGANATLNTNRFILTNDNNNVVNIAGLMTNGHVAYVDNNSLNVDDVEVATLASSVTTTGITVVNPGGSNDAGTDGPGVTGGDVILRAGIDFTLTTVLTAGSILNVTSLNPINTTSGTGGDLLIGGGVEANAALTLGSGDINLAGSDPDICIDTATIITLAPADSTATLQPNGNIIVHKPLSTLGGGLTLNADANSDGNGGVWVRDDGSIHADGALFVRGSEITASVSCGTPVPPEGTTVGIKIDDTTAGTEINANTSVILETKTINGTSGGDDDVVLTGDVHLDGGGDISIAAENRITQAATSSVSTDSAGGIYYQANDMIIDTFSAVINAQANGLVHLRNRSAGLAINLGSAASTASGVVATTLSLSNPELGRISTASAVRIGFNTAFTTSSPNTPNALTTAGNAGTITVSEPNIHLQPQNLVLHLITGADIKDDGVDGTITQTNLALEAVTGIDMDNVDAVAGFSGNDVDNLAVRLTGAAPDSDGTFKDVDNVNFAVVDGVAGANAVNVVSDFTLIAGGAVTQSAAIVSGGLELIDLFNDPIPPATFLDFPTWYLPHSSNQIGTLAAYTQRNVDVTNSTTLTVDAVDNFFRAFPPAPSSEGIWAQSVQLTAPTVVVNSPIETNDELGFVTFDVTALLDINANVFSRGKIEQIGTGRTTIADVALRTTDDNVTFLGGVTLDGIATNGTPATISTDANWTTPFAGFVPAPVNAAATTGGGDITFNSTLRSNPSGDTAAAYLGNELDLESGTGNIAFIGQVGGASIPPGAGRVGIVRIVDAHNVTASTGFSANAFYQLAGTGKTEFDGFVQTNRANLANGNGVDITTKEIKLAAGMVTTSAPGSGASGVVNLNNSGTLTIVAGAGSITSEGAVTQVGTGDNLVGGNIITTNDNISFASDTYTAGSPLQINAGSGNVSFAKRFQVNAHTVTIRETSPVSLGTVTAFGGGTLNVINHATGTVGSGTLEVGVGELLTGAGTINGGVTVLGVSGAGGNGGTISPALDASGLGTGILNVVGNVTFGPNTAFAADLNGLVVGTSYDQLNVTGTVTLNAETVFSGTRPVTFNPALASTLTPINSSAVGIVGTFANAANAAYVYINGLYFQASYNGTGDFVLTRGDAAGPIPPAKLIIDDNGFTVGPLAAGGSFFVNPNTTAAWSPNSITGNGYKNDLRFSQGVAGGTNKATWQFTGLNPGDIYRVSATWFANSNRSNNAPFTVIGTATTNVAVNQRLVPAGLTDDGKTWKDLVTNVTVPASGIITVELTNNTTTGYVIADAIRIERTVTTSTEIQVTQTATGVDVADGISIVDFGATGLGTPISKTFTITNVGVAPLQLTSASVTVPAGFTVSGYNPQTLAMGGTASFTVTFTAATVADYSGQVSFNNNDFDENAFNFTVKGSVTAADTLIADNPVKPSAKNVFNTIAAGDPLGTLSPSMTYVETGNWHDNDNAFFGYRDDLRYAAPNTNATAAFAFSGLAAGTYQISVTYRAEPNRATNASFTINGGAPIPVNQTAAPADFLDQGVFWEDLDAGFVFGGGTITVQLNALGSNGYVIADAIRIRKIA